MTPAQSPEARAARVCLVPLAWKAAHTYADHIGQDRDDALGKGRPGWPGRAACARHVAGLTLTKLAALAVAGAATGIRHSPRRVRTAYAAEVANRS
jgi:hypothetical protein